MWRLGGKTSDFDFDHGKFSGQKHYATVRGQNETHTLVAIFDNAIGIGSNEKASYKNSPGLLLALHHERVTASVAAQYDHPRGRMANSRASFQTLPNGNVFLRWTYHTLLSEHTADGRLIMEAELELPGHCYRSYKFPWIGRPAQPPGVYSTTIGKNGTLQTIVHVSWNGSRKLYRLDETGNAMERISSLPRQGFETLLVQHAYANYVVAEAVDERGSPLGRSDFITTISPSSKLDDRVFDGRVVASSAH